MLVKNPGFTVVAVLTLALGIGANTAIFSLIDAVLLKFLPVQQPERLVRLTHVDKLGNAEELFSYPTFRLLEKNNATLSGLIAFRSLENLDFVVDGHAELARGQAVSGNYFASLGVKTALGRTFDAVDDDVQGASPVVMISYGYWTRRFNQNSSAVGTRITLDGAPFTIIGVSAPEFFGVEPGQSVDVSIPLAQVPSVRSGWAATGSPYYIFSAPFRNWLHIMARLGDAASMPTATANLEPVYAEAMREAAEGPRGLPFDSPQAEQAMYESKIRLEPGSHGLTSLRRQFSKPLLFLMVVVGVLLLISCLNVANLLLARANSRQKEIALRGALGAGRLRVIRQLFTESVLLAFIGGALGVLLAHWGSSSLVALMSHSRSPIQLSVRPDLTVLAFTVVVSFIAAGSFGLAPAWSASRPQLLTTMKGSPEGFGVRQWLRLGECLVTFQIALSLTLVIGAGLLLRTLKQLKDLKPGFNPENVQLFSVSPGMVGYNDPQVIELYEDLSDRIKAIPGVREVSFSTFSPLGASSTFTDVSVEGNAPRPGVSTGVSVNFVSPGYFKTLGTAVFGGREFSDSDRVGAKKVAVINQAMARVFFGDSNPIGRRFSIPGWKGDASPLEIVGLVKDTKLDDMRSQPPPAAYMPFLQAPDSFLSTTFEILAAANSDLISASVSNLVRQADARVPVFDFKTLTEQMNESMVQERLVASLSSIFSSLALFLACIGLYGLLAYSVTQRTREIGIRMALGAHPVQVLQLILNRGIALVLIGLGVGLLAALTLTRLMASLLYGVSHTDLVTILVASLILITVSGLACFVPARRAASVDPMIALRYE